MVTRRRQRPPHAEPDLPPIRADEVDAGQQVRVHVGLAAAQGQAFLAAARILFAAKQVALHEAAEHTAQREAAYKAGRS